VSGFDPLLGHAVVRGLNASLFTDDTTKMLPVYVRCYTSDRAFNDAGAWRFGEDVSGEIPYTMRKEKTVYMRPGDCQNARGFVNALKAGQTPNKFQVFGFSTLLHEGLHVQGIRNERTTECFANDSIRWTAMNVYGMPKPDANTLS